MNWIGTKNLGMLLLAIWLIASGVLTFVQINVAPLATCHAGLNKTSANARTFL